MRLDHSPNSAASQALRPPFLPGQVLSLADRGKGLGIGGLTSRDWTPELDSLQRYIEEHLESTKALGFKVEERPKP